LWRIYGPIKDNLRIEWRRTKNIELERLYSDSDTFKIIRRGKYCKDYARRSQNPLLSALISEPVGKGPIEIPRKRWDDVIKN